MRRQTVRLDLHFNSPQPLSVAGLRKDAPMSIYKRGNVYWLNVSDKAGRQVRRSAKTADRKEAIRLESALRLEIHQTVPVLDIAGASKKPSIGFDRLMDEFLEHQRSIGRRSMHTYFGSHSKQARLWFKNVDIAEIDTRMVERFRSERISVSSVATGNRYVALLRRAFNLAIRWGYLDRNPAKGLDYLKEPKRVERVLTHKEQAEYLAACAPGFRTFAWLALRTGMRRGELQGLRVGDIDSWRSRISIPISKAGSSRHIPVMPRVIEALGRLAQGKRPEDLLLTDVNGRPWTHTMMRRRHRQAVRRSGLPWFRFHDLRHTFASDMLASGAQLTVIQKILGHASIKTTQIYAHLVPKFLESELKNYGSYVSDNNTVKDTISEVLELEGIDKINAPD